MPKATIDRHHIAYDDYGHGEPALLALPGWCDSRTQFAHVAPELAARQRVLTLDWRGHGDSDVPATDFSAADLVGDALTVIARGGARQVIPLAVSHAGWIAIELRRRLGAQRVPAIVALDWIVLTPPPPFLDALAGLQDPARWSAVRDGLFAMWLGESGHPAVRAHIHERMGAHGREMWARAGREIASAYARRGSPLAALGDLDPPPRVLHLFSQPRDEGYLAAQRAFADTHPWFSVQRLDGATHFPTLETPAEVAAAVAAFVAPPLPGEGALRRPA